MRSRRGDLGAPDLPALPILAVLGPFPLVVGSPYYIHLGCLAVMWALLAQAWNLLGGFCGQVSFGHAAFFGVGAYAGGIAATAGGLSPWWGLALSVPVTIVLSVVMGLVCFRLRGPYFSLSMLALSQILRVAATNLTGVTGGAQGLLVVPAWASAVPFYYVALLLAATAYLICRWFLASRWGLFALAVRDDEDAAAAAGVPAFRVKMLSLVLSGILTGLGGAFYMNYFGYIEPAIVFSLPEVSIAMVLVTVLGGTGTLAGPVIGAGAMVALSEFSRRHLGRGHLLLLGCSVILVIRFLPSGLVGLGHSLRRARHSRRANRLGGERPL
jgi:branched-chain amino acid transport system permease protein